MNKIIRNAALALLASSALAVAAPASADRMGHQNNANNGGAAAHFNHGGGRANLGHRGGFMRTPHVAFRGHFNHFSPGQRAAWSRGRWTHGWHHGHWGWWWGVSGSWFFYNAPIYPYPLYTSNVYYDDRGGDDYGYDSDGPGQASGSWYHCADPEGYYPYVKSCRGEWDRVAPTPQAMDDRGPPPGGQQGYSDDDRGPPPGDMGPDDDQGPGDQDDDNGPPPR